MNLANIDLNLLVHLDALLQEIHVTNAGKRVGLSQSAMSRALSKLRDLFGDELLIKTAHGMVLSPKAQQLAPAVRQVLRDVERTLEPDLPFQPEQEAHTFNLAVSPLATRGVSVHLLTQLHNTSPGLRCEMRPLPEEFPLAALQRGELDLVLSTGTTLPTAYRAQELFREELVTVTPAHIEAPRSAREWAELPHAIFHLHGDLFDRADLVLAQMGIKRNVAMTIHSLAIVKMVVDELGLAITLPKSEALQHFTPQRLHAPPVQLPHVLTLMSWSAHLEQDPANIWLRQTLLSTLMTHKQNVT